MVMRKTLSKNSMFSLYYYHSYGIKVALSWYNAIWWKLMPGTKIKVRWPVGDIVITEDDPRWDWLLGPSRYIVQSADPNDHYRLWMEQNVGKQGWDWDWAMTDNDLAENRLTIKFRRGREQHAMMAAMNWT
jgi:hypothetical protein